MFLKYTCQVDLSSNQVDTTNKSAKTKESKEDTQHTNGQCLYT